MNQTMEKYEANESKGNKSWILCKAVSVGKKVLAAGVVLSSAPLLFPLLVVALTIAFISAVPYCLFLANYALTRKIMSSLLPANEEETGGQNETNYSRFEDSKVGHGAGFHEVEPWMATHEPAEETEGTTNESTSLIEKIMGAGRTDRRTSEKQVEDGEKSEKVNDQAGKQEEAPETGHEGERGGTSTETFTGKDEETSPNEAYSEEQVWEKMGALRKVVGYSVARSATYAEELKALYVFTGVIEPPWSRLNQDGHDMVHVTVRLRFLMSVIGIN